MAKPRRSYAWHGCFTLRTIASKEFMRLLQQGMLVRWSSEWLAFSLHFSSCARAGLRAGRSIEI
jgi:hypothetical protein